MGEHVRTVIHGADFMYNIFHHILSR
jgi:hypothetical protein